MKIQQFRSILAVATVVTSITASSLPSQAFSWDDLWGVVKKEVVKELQPSSKSTPSKNESTTSDPGSDDESKQSDSESSDSPKRTERSKRE
jgi:hypothetical protein